MATIKRKRRHSPQGQAAVGDDPQPVGAVERELEGRWDMPGALEAAAWSEQSLLQATSLQAHEGFEGLNDPGRKFDRSSSELDSNIQEQYSFKLCSRHFKRLLCRCSEHHHRPVCAGWCGRLRRQ